MKNLKFFFLVSISLFILIQNSYTQEYDPLFGFGCDNTTTNPPDYPLPEIGGYLKPERTDQYPGTSSTSVFRVLIIFVEFLNDDHNPTFLDWPAMSNGPIYKDNLLTFYRSTNYGNEWWNAYNESTATLSDYFMEISRGHFHVVGKAYHIILDNEYTYYQQAGKKIEAINSEIYDALDYTPNFLWEDYDNWKYINGHEYGENNIVDMIYVFHRTRRPNIGFPNKSIAKLYNSLQGWEHTTHQGQQIMANLSVGGSGCTFTPGNNYDPFTKDQIIGLQCHEFGHYLFGTNHGNYGIMAGGRWDFFTGLDSRPSPWETIKLGYMEPEVVDFNYPYYDIGDFSSRDNSQTGQVLEVPINGEHEFFLIAYRNKESSYDRIMHGDTAHDNPYRQLYDENYGKGVYIYHSAARYSIYPPDKIDQECADGLWNWDTTSMFFPDWSTSQLLTFFEKTEVSRCTNDVSIGGLINTDGKSVSKHGTHSAEKWGSFGKLPIPPNGIDGTDRIFTNDQYRWTSREWKGDRWDAWREDYNEIFSPYSSPSTDYWFNNPTGIYIWLADESNGRAYFEIYKPDPPTLTNDDILELTPPSRPMGIFIDEYYPPGNPSICHPKIVWEHNTEPDMKNPNNGDEKQYEIYKAKENNMNTVPNNYVWLATVYSFDDPNNPNDKPFYIDTEERKYDCILLDGPPYGTPIPLRYYVIAVDKHCSTSVPSDFASTVGIADGGKEQGGENPIFINNEIPDVFNLHPNFPNPFNPVTNIQFDLPNDVSVSIKVYDITGKEVAVLVNEFKKAGIYIVAFNGSKLSSGVYFYKIEAGSFTDIKRMVLIK